MISQLSGNIAHKGPRSIILDVAGVGYEINLSEEALFEAEIGTTQTYWTHLAVRENSMELFGFNTQNELQFFNMLLDVSGIGPRSALGIISIASLETLKKAIATKDISYLTKVSGIGKKTAEKIVVELQDKFSKEMGGEDMGVLREASEALEALQALGYSLHQSRDALKQIDSEGMNTNERIKEALKIINNK